MSSASGCYAPGPQGFCPCDYHKWRETNENLSEMCCLKYQSAFVLYLRPDYDSIPFLKIYLGTYQKRQKTSMKFRKCGFNRQNVVIFRGFAPDPKVLCPWDYHRWRETNENLSEMWCLKYQSAFVLCHQLRPDYDPIPFLKDLPLNLSEATEN